MCVFADPIFWLALFEPATTIRTKFGFLGKS